MLGGVLCYWIMCDHARLCQIGIRVTLSKFLDWWLDKENTRFLHTLSSSR